MRIDDAKELGGAKVDGARGTRGGASLRNALGFEDGDRVQVSDTARLLVRLKAEVGPVNTVRNDVVARLRDQVASGEYQPDFGTVAQNMLRDVMTQAVV